MNLSIQHYTGYQGVQLCADVGGDPDNPPVILLHGGGQTRYSWGRAARNLAANGYYVIALDLRGHGDSGWSEVGDYSLDAFVNDLKSVIATLKRPPALVGASLGGVASLLCIGEPAAPAVSALILVDVVPRMSSVGMKHIGDFMRGNLDGFASLSDAADAVARYLPNRPRPSSTEGLKKNLRLKEDGRYYWHWDPQFQTGRQRVNSQELFERLEGAAVQVKVPTLLVRGKQSEMVSLEGAQLLLQLIPQAHLVDVDGAGHMVAGDKNDSFNQAVESFLEMTLQSDCHIQ